MDLILWVDLPEYSSIGKRMETRQIVAVEWIAPLLLFSIWMTQFHSTSSAATVFFQLSEIEDLI